MKRSIVLLALFPALLTACAGAPPKPTVAQTGPLWSDPARIDAFCESTLAEVTTVRALLQKEDVPATVDGVLRPLDRALAALDVAAGWSSLLYNVHPDEKLREAGRACEERAQKLANELSMDRKVYEAVAALDLSGADPLAARFAHHVLRDFRRSGVDKDEATRTRLAAIFEEMVKLTQTFGENVRNDVRRIELDDPAALEGLPADWIASHPPGEDGKIVVTTDYPDFFPFQNYAKRDALRKALFEAYLRRGYPVNADLLRKLLVLRDEYASTLGFTDWAEYNAEDKMVRSAKTIQDFLARVETLVRPRMEKDLEIFLAAKREEHPEATTVEVWDRFYLAGKVRKSAHDFDPQSVRPYFSYPKVKQGILDLYGELFGLSFVRLEGEPVWDAAVEAWSLRDGEEEIGRFYLDMHPREGKYKHAAAFTIQTGVEGGRMPMASLVCNFPDPKVGDGSALMEHSDVETFFHEFGHLIHHLLARRGEWVRLAGFNVEWDFVEAPSQLLEEWAWDPQVLQRFAHHVETGEPIPAELVARMKAAESVGKGVDTMRQIFLAAYSFYVHRTEPASLNLDRFTDEMYARYSPFPRSEDTHIYASFGHLTGYSSMYYTYQWSLTLAKDLFSRFKAEGIMSPETARAYRRAILEKGGTVDAADMVQEFLGRPTSLEPYEAWLRED